MSQFVSVCSGYFGFAHEEKPTRGWKQHKSIVLIASLPLRSEARAVIYTSTLQRKTHNKYLQYKHMSDEWEREGGDSKGRRNKRKMTKRVIYRQRMKHADFKEKSLQKIDIWAVANTSSICYETVRDMSAKDDLIKTFSAIEHHVSLHSQTVGLLCKVEGNI